MELGNNYWLVLGPLVAVLALVVCIGLVVYMARRQRQLGPSDGRPPDAATDRGDVTGGTIKGSPVQRNRRDEAPRRDSQ